MFSPRTGFPALLLPILLLPALAPALAGGPIRIGELEHTRVASPHPYAPGEGPGAREWTIHHPGATYIRVHFRRVDLAAGDWLELRSPDGRQVFAYEGRGPQGRSEFWANTIFGDTAVLRLEAGGGGGFGFHVDRYGRGTAALEGTSISCGATDWQNAICYQGGPHQAEYVRSRSTARMVVGCCDACTGFAVSDQAQYLTSYSCISTGAQAKDTELWTGFVAEDCGGTASGTGWHPMGHRVAAKSAQLGYSLLEVFLPPNRSRGGDVRSFFGLPRCLELAAAPAAATDPIYIPHYPDGLGRQISLLSDMDVAGVCQVASGATPASPDVGYLCDTGAGSEGAPVISSIDHQVVAMHLGGGCSGTGVSADRIRAEIDSVLDGCQPVPLSCSNGVLDHPAEECDGADLGGQTCESLGALFGELACADDCRFDRSDCFSECLIIPNGVCNCDGHCTGKERNQGQCPFDCDA